MSAKPIIDILAGVGSMVIAQSLADSLLCSGYTTSAEFNATLIDRLWFMRWFEGRRTHHLHVVVFDGEEWRNRLLFRDMLRVDLDLAHRYVELKKMLAVTCKTDREAYTEAKREFILKTGS